MATENLCHFALALMVCAGVHSKRIQGCEGSWTIFTGVRGFILQVFDFDMCHHIVSISIRHVANQAFPLVSTLLEAARNVLLPLGVVICNVGTYTSNHLPKISAILRSLRCIL